MSEWQPISKAPADVTVELGGWNNDYTTKKAWWTKIGEAKVTRLGLWGGVKVEMVKHNNYYTHWRPLPPPPRE